MSVVLVHGGLGHHDTSGRLGAIWAPTLVLVGERDAAPDQARALVERSRTPGCPSSRGAGLISNLRVPARFSAELEAFLSVP